MNTEHGCLDIDECQVGKECEVRISSASTLRDPSSAWPVIRLAMGANLTGQTIALNARRDSRRERMMCVWRTRMLTRTMRRLSRRMAQKKGMRRRTKADLFRPQVHLMMVQSYQIPKKNSKTVISHFHPTSASNKLAE